MSTAQAHAAEAPATTAVSLRTQHPADAPAGRQSPSAASPDTGIAEAADGLGVADSAKAPPSVAEVSAPLAVTPSVPPAAPAEPVGDRDAQRDLEALARCLGALLGSAMPIIRIPGGQGAGSPAEHVQGHLGRARRALGRLAALRETHYGHVLVLLYAYVHLGEEHRVGEWHARVRNVLLPRASGKGGKGIAAASGALGRRLVLAAEDAYARAAEVPSDGRWLATDLAEVALLAAGGPVKVARAAAREPEERECAPCAVPCVGELCAKGRRLGPRVRWRARAVRVSCAGAAAGSACVTPTRWRVVAGALLPSATATSTVVQGGAGTTWELLRDAAAEVAS